MSDLLPDPSTLSSPSRRAILGAAWTVPVVVAASAAPGYAASASATLRFDTLTSYAADWAGSTPTRIMTKLQVQHAWSANAPDVTDLTVSVVFPAAFAAGGAATSVTGEGWKAGSVTGSADTGWTYTFSWTGQLASSRSTSELGFLVPRWAVKQANGTVTAYASSSRSTTVSRTEQGRL